MSPTWQCTVCGYIYNMEAGDDENGIPPNVPFQELPADWQCPDCGAAKSHYNRVD